MDIDELATNLSGKCRNCTQGKHQMCTGCECGSSYHG